MSRKPGGTGLGIIRSGRDSADAKRAGLNCSTRMRTRQPWLILKTGQGMRTLLAGPDSSDDQLHYLMRASISKLISIPN